MFLSRRFLHGFCSLLYSDGSHAKSLMGYVFSSADFSLTLGFVCVCVCGSYQDSILERIWSCGGRIHLCLLGIMGQYDVTGPPEG